jgi:hypothetical protein
MNSITREELLNYGVSKIEITGRGSIFPTNDEGIRRLIFGSFEDAHSWRTSLPQEEYFEGDCNFQPKTSPVCAVAGEVTTRFQRLVSFCATGDSSYTHVTERCTVTRVSNGRNWDVTIDFADAVAPSSLAKERRSWGEDANTATFSRFIDGRSKVGEWMHTESGRSGCTRKAR